MNTRHSRRQILTTAVRGALGAALCTGPGALLATRAFAATGDLGLTPLAENLSLITGAGSNVLVLEGPDSLLLVDSGAPEVAAALPAFLSENFSGKPVATLFNTHWHEHNTGANEALGAAGVEIIAHENTRLWMAHEYYVEWEDRNYEPRAAAALPTRTFYASDPQPRTLQHGGQRIEFGLLPEAHTDGDIYVHFVDSDVFAVGDTLWSEHFPILDYSTGGWIGGLQGATEQLLEMTGPASQIVPGTGPVQTRAALQTQIAMLDDMRERIRIRIIAGKSVEEILAEPVAEGYEALGSPAQFVHNVYNGLWWGGRLRGAY